VESIHEARVDCLGLRGLLPVARKAERMPRYGALGDMKALASVGSGGEWTSPRYFLPCIDDDETSLLRIVLNPSCLSLKAELMRQIVKAIQELQRGGAPANR